MKDYIVGAGNGRTAADVMFWREYSDNIEYSGKLLPEEAIDVNAHNTGFNTSFRYLMIIRKPW
jgi:hypothetical protein